MSPAQHGFRKMPATGLQRCYFLLRKLMADLLSFLQAQKGAGSWQELMLLAVEVLLNQGSKVMEVPGPVLTALVAGTGKFAEAPLDFLMLAFQLGDKAPGTVAIFKRFIETSLLCLHVPPKLNIELIEQPITAPRATACHGAGNVAAEFRDVGVVVRDQVPKIHGIAPPIESKYQRALDMGSSAQDLYPKAF
jgi:hypothetical protein